jgi:stage II sporulation protein M
LSYYNRDVIANNIRKNMGIYITVTLFFVIGISIGAITIKALGYNEKQNLVLFMNKFFQIVDKEQIKGASIFYQSLKNNFQTIFFIWFLSITVIGIPVTLFIISFRGFIVGFAVAFFIDGMGLKGIILTILTILPQNIIYIPCIVALAAISIKYSLNVLKRNLGNGAVQHYRNNILNYTIIVSIIFVIMCFGSLVEAYLSPQLLKSISNYIIMQ